MLRIIQKNQEGMAAIMMTVLILASILTITMVANIVIMNNLAMNMTQVDATKAFFASEAGAERILFQTRKEDLDFLSIGCNSFGLNVCFNGASFIASSTACSGNCASAGLVGSVVLSNTSEVALQYVATTTPDATVAITAIGVYGDAIRNTKVEY